jgi:hypothetical protein
MKNIVVLIGKPVGASLLAMNLRATGFFKKHA